MRPDQVPNKLDCTTTKQTVLLDCESDCVQKTEKGYRVEVVSLPIGKKAIIAGGERLIAAINAAGSGKFVVWKTGEGFETQWHIEPADESPKERKKKWSTTEG